MDLFDEFIKEASTGRVDCGMYFNILFNSKIEDNYIGSDSDLLVPTLIVKDKISFLTLLNKYLDIATIFYSNKKIDVTNERKMLLATLFSNMTSNDFNNPDIYIKRRINFMLDNTLKKELSFYSKHLESDVIVKIDKNYPYDETPYSFNISLKRNEFVCNMPSIRFGIDNGVCYIYAIQNKRQEKNDYIKKINRKLYVINSGVQEEEYEENVTDVTMSFVLSLSVMFGVLNRENINNFVVVPLLIERWNAKKIMFDIKEQFNLFKGNHSTLKEDLEKQEDIQKNLTEKFIRTFRRIEYHFSNINIVSYPFEIDDNMYIVNNNNYSFNNELLDEMYRGDSFEKNGHNL